MDSLIEQIWRQRMAFFATFFIVFTFSYIVLLAVDFLPEPPTEEEIEVENHDSATSTIEGMAIDADNSSLATTTDDVIVVGETVLPLTISIPKLGTEVSVANPVSRTIADLDNALLDGVVRHPDSATLAQEGTVFILGHSSYLPTVFNSNFKAFNGIQNLAWGDTIDVYSEKSVYQYRVEKVYRANAQDVTVPIAGAGHTLTLATCNSFGSVDDRYIVESKLIEVRAL